MRAVHVMMLAIVEIVFGDVFHDVALMLGVVMVQVAVLLVLGDRIGAIRHGVEVLRHLLAFCLLDSSLFDLQPSEHRDENDEDQNPKATADN